METAFLAEVRRRYLSSLTDDILPFWLRHGLDSVHGGYITGLDRTGAVIEDDKSVWFQGRFAWVLTAVARRHPDHQDRARWIEAARSGIEFLRTHGQDTDGRFWYRLTRDGKPLVKRRYAFSDCFAAMAEAGWAAATDDPEALRRARSHLRRVLAFLDDANAQSPKFDPRTRPTVGLAEPMILVNVAQELRSAALDLAPQLAPVDLDLADWATDVIAQQIEHIVAKFYRPEIRCLLEQVAPDGALLDHFEGRSVNPGHSIEAAWFILREASITQEPERAKRYTHIGTSVLDWMLERGWDERYGGLLYYLDALGRPQAEYWHDMKFWWPHAEALIGTLYAYRLTDDPKYLRWFQRIDQWTHTHFPDHVHGEWFGYLHRDGTVSTTLKGNMFKGPFHIPRMYLVASELLGPSL